MPAPVLQVKRGALSNLPGLKAGEPAFTTDSYDFYVGIDSTTNNNKFVGSHRYWRKETASAGSGVNLVEATGGSDFITLAAPASVGAAITFYFPASQGSSGSVLTNDGSGNLSWGSGSNNATFTGITTFSDTTDSTSKDTGAIIVEGGIGIEKSVNIGGNLNVTGLSTFNGLVVGNNGINVSGFSTIYNLHVTAGLNVGGKLDLDGVLDAGNDAVFAGITSFVNTTQSTTYDNGAVVLDGGLGVQKNVNVGGNLNVTGNVTVGGTTITLKSEDVFIENKDIILGFTTAVTPNDDTANHAGVAIASTVGSPLVSFVASGINTLPDTYKQLMWFKSGTLGFSTDTFAFNYGLAIGTTTMADGVRLSVGTGVTVSDTTVTATTFYGALSGNASSATTASSADQVKTVTASDTAANYYVTFVDSHNGSATSENVYTDDGIYYNPGANKLTTQHAEFTGDVLVSGITTLAGNVSIGNSSSDIITIAGITTFTTSNVYIDNQLYVGGIQVTGGASIGEDISARHLNLSGIATVSGLIDGNGGLDITGHTELDDVNVSGVVTATTFIGNLTGTATTATRATTVDTTGVATNQNYNLTFTDGSGTGKTVGVDSELLYNPNTNVLSAPNINSGAIRAADGTSAITITNTTGAVGFANSVVISGDLYVLGTATEVNTDTLKVQDPLIDLGLIDNGSGQLIPPTSDLNLDIGILLNWYSGSAKKASVYWDDSAGRVGIASDVTESSGVLTANAYAAVEIGSLWVTDCAGTSQVISCTGAERFLENITVDAGTF